MMNNLEQQLQALPEPYVVMGVGIPGSGKTTVLSEVAEHLYINRISPDEIREELTGNQANQSVNAEAWDETYRRVQATLELGRSVIIDATHAEAFRRPQTVEMYRSFGAVAVVAIVFDTPIDIAKQRNVARDRVVPKYVLDEMHTALTQEPVSTDEGFDEIIVMRT
jgi:predicted kinase